ncbi:MAG: hypothetical protein ACI4UX_04465 [Clostridia bacterium]
MEKKEIKISLGTAICIFIIVVLLVIIGAMYYKLNNKTKNVAKVDNTVKVEETEENKTTKEEIPIEDLYGIDYLWIQEYNRNYNGDVRLAKISNETLYYLDVTALDDDKNSYLYPFKESYKKIDTDVKRIKTIELGNDVKINYLVIKNDGTVMELGFYNGKISYMKFEELAGFKVDDILEFDGETFTLKMLDGTIKKPQHFSGGSEEAYQETKEYNENLLKEINKKQ